MTPRQGFPEAASALLLFLAIVIVPLFVATLGAFLDHDPTRIAVAAATAAVASVLGMFGLDRWRARSLDRRFAQFFATLEAAGYLDRVARKRVDAVRKRVLEERDPFLIETKRVFFFDSEDLAEGGVADLLKELAPHLRRRGVSELSVDEDFDPAQSRYGVTVNGRPVTIYSDGEKDLWDKATSRSFALVNELLTAAGSSERAYMVDAGNDGLGVFLSEMQRGLCGRIPGFPEGRTPTIGK
jgi:hypothetical protein